MFSYSFFFLRLINSKEDLFDYENLYSILIYILLLEKGMANSFEQNHEIIMECNG